MQIQNRHFIEHLECTFRTAHFNLSKQHNTTKGVFSLTDIQIQAQQWADFTHTHHKTKIQIEIEIEITTVAVNELCNLG